MQTILSNHRPIDWDFYIEGYLASLFLNGDLGKAWKLEIYPRELQTSSKEYSKLLSWDAGWNSNLLPLVDNLAKSIIDRMV